MILKQRAFIIDALKNKWAIAIISALLFFVLSYYLTVFTVFQYSLSIYIQMNGFYYTVVSMLLNVLISVLVGINTAILAYNIDMKKSVCSISGGAIAIFTSGCPTCGALLFSLLGYPLALMALPWKGLELKIVSIILLALYIQLITSNKKRLGATNACETSFTLALKGVSFKKNI